MEGRIIFGKFHQFSVKSITFYYNCVKKFLTKDIKINNKGGKIQFLFLFIKCEFGPGHKLDFSGCHNSNGC